LNANQSRCPEHERGQCKKLVKFMTPKGLRCHAHSPVDHTLRERLPLHIYYNAALIASRTLHRLSCKRFTQKRKQDGKDAGIVTAKKRIAFNSQLPIVGFYGIRMIVEQRHGIQDLEPFFTSLSAKRNGQILIRIFNKTWSCIEANSIDTLLYVITHVSDAQGQVDMLLNMTKNSSHVDNCMHRSKKMDTTYFYGDAYTCVIIGKLLYRWLFCSLCETQIFSKHSNTLNRMRNNIFQKTQSVYIAGPDTEDMTYDKHSLHNNHITETWLNFSDESKFFGEEACIYCLLTIDDREDYPWNRFEREHSSPMYNYVREFIPLLRKTQRVMNDNINVEFVQQQTGDSLEILAQFNK